MAGAPGPAGRAGVMRGVGILGTELVWTTPGRGAAGAGVATTAAGRETSLPGGIGCRGPDRICPGLGAGGAGFTGIEAPRPIGGVSGTAGDPVAKGGRRGGASRAGADSSTVSFSPSAGASTRAAGCGRCGSEGATRVGCSAIAAGA